MEIWVSFQFKKRGLICRSTNSLHVSLDRNTSWRNSLGKCFKIFPGLWFSVASKEEPARLSSLNLDRCTTSLFVYCTHVDYKIGWRDDVICAGYAEKKRYLEDELGRKAIGRETIRLNYTRGLNANQEGTGSRTVIDTRSNPPPLNVRVQFCLVLLL